MHARSVTRLLVSSRWLFAGWMLLVCRADAATGEKYEEGPNELRSTPQVRIVCTRPLASHGHPPLPNFTRQNDRQKQSSPNHCSEEEPRDVAAHTHTGQMAVACRGTTKDSLDFPLLAKVGGRTKVPDQMATSNIRESAWNEQFAPNRTDSGVCVWGYEGPCSSAGSTAQALRRLKEPTRRSISPSIPRNFLTQIYLPTQRAAAKWTIYCVAALDVQSI